MRKLKSVNINDQAWSLIWHQIKDQAWLQTRDSSQYNQAIYRIWVHTVDQVKDKLNEKS